MPRFNRRHPNAPSSTGVLSPAPPEPGNGWFPRLDQQGRGLSGAGTIWHDGREIYQPGYQPKWLTDGLSFVCQGANDALFEVTVEGVGHQVHGPMHIFAAGAGKWYVANRAAGEIDCEIDPVTGDLVTVVEHNGDNNDHGIAINGALIYDHAPVNDVRSVDGFVVWRHYGLNTMGYLGGEVRNLAVLKSGWEGGPVPIATNEGPWLLFQTNVDLRLRPIGSVEGYIIATGEDQNFHPDALGLGDVIRVTWNDQHGYRHTQDVSLLGARTPVDVGVGPPDPPDPPDPEPTPPPAITITSYAPTSGPAPLTVTAVWEQEPGSGPITRLSWQARDHDTSEAWQERGTTPPDVPSFDYRFDAPGTYELRLIAYGPGGDHATGALRLVTATTAPVPPDPEPPDPTLPPAEDIMLRAYGQPMAGFLPGTEHDNGDGTISVQKANGKWLCVTPEGSVEERDSPGGVWESFKKGQGCLIAERDGEAKGPLVYVLPAAATND